MLSVLFEVERWEAFPFKYFFDCLDWLLWAPQLLKDRVLIMARPALPYDFEVEKPSCGLTLMGKFFFFSELPVLSPPKLLKIDPRWKALVFTKLSMAEGAYLSS